MPDAAGVAPGRLHSSSAAVTTPYPPPPRYECMARAAVSQSHGTRAVDSMHAPPAANTPRSPPPYRNNLRRAKALRGVQVTAGHMQIEAAPDLQVPTTYYWLVPSLVGFQASHRRRSGSACGAACPQTVCSHGRTLACTIPQTQFVGPQTHDPRRTCQALKSTSRAGHATPPPPTPTSCTPAPGSNSAMCLPRLWGVGTAAVHIAQQTKHTSRQHTGGVLCQNSPVSL